METVFDRMTRGEMVKTFAAFLVAASTVVLALLAVDVRPAHAANTFVVNSTADGGDNDTADNTCFTGNTFFRLVGNVLVKESECTLRAAIQQANATADADTIGFSVSSAALSIGGRSEEAAATGDLDITQDVTIDGGADGVTVAADSNFNDRIFHVVSPAKATLENLTVTGGEEINGGGIYVAYGATLNLGHSTVSDNTASHSAGYPGGGGIYSAGTLTVTNSTFNDNKAIGGTLYSSYGGGIYNDLSDLTLTNVTVSGNTAGYQGGGIFNVNPFSNLRLTNVTLNNNSAPDGANVYHYSGLVTYKNTLVANPHGGTNCAGSGSATLGHNLEYPGTTCGFTATQDIQTQDPKLGSLGGDGGPNRTHELLSGSPAIDAASNATCPSTDQRGVVRPRDGDSNGTFVCDIGAFEASGPLNTKPTITNVRPTPDSTTRDTTPLVGATVRDAQTNLSKNNMKLYVDGRPKTAFSYDRTADRLSYTSGRLSFGRHTVKIVATDAQGLNATRSWSFKVAR